VKDSFSLQQLEALQAVAAEGTTAKAAARLRVTQSAVSKRVAALEVAVGGVLLEPHGRGVRLTPAAKRLLESASPLLASLRDVVASVARSDERAPLRVAASESLLASWLPRAIAAASRRARVPVELHAHRGPVVIERVRSGDYALAICVDAGAEKDLARRDLLDERMVVVPNAMEAARDGEPLRVLAIEERSLTWQAIAPRLRSTKRPVEPRMEVVGRMESFTALVQVAKAGLGAALVPEGVALAMGVSSRELIAVRGLTRPIAAFARRTTLRATPTAAWLDALAEEVSD